MCRNVWSAFALILVLDGLEAPGQSLIMSDDFEVPGTAINSSLWPYTAGTRVEAIPLDEVRRILRKYGH